MCNAHHVR